MDAERAVEREAPHLLVLGPGATDRDGTPDLVRRLRARCPELLILAVGAHDAAAPAVAVLQAGAADYVVLTAGADAGELRRAIDRLPTRERAGPRRAPRRAQDATIGLVGSSGAVEQV